VLSQAISANFYAAVKRIAWTSRRAIVFIVTLDSAANYKEIDRE
jgi:hypothetical protein